KNWTKQQKKEAQDWVNKTYNSLSQDEKLGQLFIVALYTNKGDEHIEQVRQLVKNEQLGGLILMQDDAQKHSELVNEFQGYSKTPMLIGMDAEWGVYQRINTAYKFPWAITLGAIQDKKLIKKMAAQIAQDAKKIGVNWDFAPVVDVNTNPSNPIIGNRSFGSEVRNVAQSALAYSIGLQDNKVLAAIKHFPGHGDTNVDSHHDLPIVSHNLDRLKRVELAPFKALINKGIGGIMVAHLYIPALEQKENTPASISYSIVTDLLKNQLKYKGLIITDALNMGAVAKHYKAGELDALAFKAGNDIMLFSEGVKEGKKQIQNAINKGEISQKRVEESVKKILLTKYYLGLNNYQPNITKDINQLINTPNHKAISQELYANAITLLKDKNKLIPFKQNETYFVLPLEEGNHQEFIHQLNERLNTKTISNLNHIPEHSKIIISLHKDNSTAYKPYTISEESKNIISNLAKKHQVILCLFGSPYALKDIEIENISSIIVAYENNDDAMFSAVKALSGDHKIHGKLPVSVNDKIKAGAGLIRKVKK
ncbi:MAG: glycoside hydrolase family 3 protein, partial [Bergeyella zoohelcum]|nr:glycoside hydrolase family 3 protein [Bergeyella zoohelcum]